MAATTKELTSQNRQRVAAGLQDARGLPIAGGNVARHWSESVTQPAGAPPVKVARVRPALVFPEDQANLHEPPVSDPFRAASGAG